MLTYGADFWPLFRTVIGATAVDFGTTPAISFTGNSDSSITATAPADAAGQRAHHQPRADLCGGGNVNLAHGATFTASIS